jgi:hypothetical protein
MIFEIVVFDGLDELALWLVEREVDAQVADRIAAHIEYPRFRPLVT